MAGSSLVSALQTIVSRSIDPKHAAVVTVGSFQAGVANNVIPREAVLKGTARWFDTGVGESMQRAIVRLAKCTAESFGATAEVEMHMVAPATVNDEAAMARLLDLGVDGIMTDRPTVLKQLLESRQAWV